MGFDLSEYEPVDHRIHRFYEDHPEGRILTFAEEVTDDRACFRAAVYTDRTDERPAATGYAYERREDGHVNRTSHVENCETSAIGRALANLGMNPKGSRPSREEMSSAAPATITAEQQQAMVKAAADAGMKPADALKVLKEVAGVESSSAVLAADFDKVMAAFTPDDPVEKVKAAFNAEEVTDEEWNK